MKQGKRKLQLDRTTIRPLDPQQLRRIVGGTATGSYFASCAGGGDDDDSDLICGVSVTQNYSNEGRC